MEAVKAITLWLAAATEAAGVAVVAVGVAEAAWSLLRMPFRRGALFRTGAPDASHEAKEEVRLRLGRWLALGLEFALGADVLRTAIAPGWSEIGQLAAIAAVRTALNHFLQRDIDAATARRAGAAPTGAAGGGTL